MIPLRPVAVAHPSIINCAHLGRGSFFFNKTDDKQTHEIATLKELFCYFAVKDYSADQNKLRQFFINKNTLKKRLLEKVNDYRQSDIKNGVEGIQPVGSTDLNFQDLWHLVNDAYGNGFGKYKCDPTMMQPTKNVKFSLATAQGEIPLVNAFDLMGKVFGSTTIAIDKYIGLLFESMGAKDDKIDWDTFSIYMHQYRGKYQNRD
jgi:hypothetical protein